MNLSRRSLLTGLIAAPAVILTPGLLMPVRRTELVTPQMFGEPLTYYADAIHPNLSGWTRITLTVIPKMDRLMTEQDWLEYRAVLNDPAWGADNGIDLVSE